METLGVKTIFVKFFDVDWEPLSRQPIPVATLQTSTYRLPDNFELIPVIFITNSCVENLDTTRPIG